MGPATYSGRSGRATDDEGLIGIEIGGILSVMVIPDINLLGRFKQQKSIWLFVGRIRGFYEHKR
jgi:hypothetical protein